MTFTEGKSLFTENFIKKVKNCEKLENKYTSLWVKKKG